MRPKEKKNSQSFCRPAWQTDATKELNTGLAEVRKNGAMSSTETHGVKITHAADAATENIRKRKKPIVANMLACHMFSTRSTNYVLPLSVHREWRRRLLEMRPDTRRVTITHSQGTCMRSRYNLFGRSFILFQRFIYFAFNNNANLNGNGRKLVLAFFIALRSVSRSVGDACSSMRYRRIDGFIFINVPPPPSLTFYFNLTSCTFWHHKWNESCESGARINSMLWG